MFFKILPLEERIVLDGALQNDFVAVQAGSTVTGNVSADNGNGADTSPSSQIGSYAPVGGPGSFSISGNNFTYNAPANFTGWTLASSSFNATDASALFIKVTTEANPTSPLEGLDEGAVFTTVNNPILPPIPTGFTRTFNGSEFVYANNDVNFSGSFLMAVDTSQGNRGIHVDVTPSADGIANLSIALGKTNPLYGEFVAINVTGNLIDTSAGLTAGGLETHTLHVEFGTTLGVQLNMGTTTDGGRTWTVDFTDLSQLNGLGFTVGTFGTSFKAYVTTVDRALGYDDPAVAGGGNLMESSVLRSSDFNSFFSATNPNSRPLYSGFSFIEGGAPITIEGWRIFDPSGVTSVEVITQPVFGNVTFTLTNVTAAYSDYTMVYTFTDPNFSGTETFVYRVTDGEGNTTDINGFANLSPIADGVQLASIAENQIGDINQPVLLNLNGTALDTSTSLTTGGLESHVLTLTFNSAVSLNQGTSLDGGITWKVDFTDFSQLSGLAFVSSATGRVEYTASVRSLDSAIVNNSLRTSTQAITSNTVSGFSTIFLPNEPPAVVQNTESTFREDAQNNVIVGVNDDRGPGFIASRQIIVGPQHGTASISGTAGGDVDIAYRPEANYSGYDQITIRVTDTGGLFTDAVVKFYTSPVTDGVQLQSLAVVSQAEVGQAIAIDLTGLQSDTSNDLMNGGVENSVLTLAFDSAVQLNRGTSSDGGFTWQVNFVTFADLAGLAFTSTTVGAGSFSAFVTSLDSAIINGSLVTGIDGPVTSNTLTANYEILAPNAPPVVGNGSIAVAEDGSGSVNITLNDDRGVAGSQIVAGPQNGVASISSTSSQATINYTPSGNYAGSDSITIRVFDTNGAFTDRVISVAVNPVADGFSGLAASLSAGSAIQGTPIALNFAGTALDASSGLASGGLESHTLQITFDAAVSLNQGSSADGGITWIINFTNLSELAGLAFTSNIAGSHSYSAFITTVDSAQVGASNAVSAPLNSALLTGNFSIQSLNQNPTITLDKNLPAVFIENQYIPALLELGVHVTDVDSPDGNWGGGVLTIKIGNPEAGDKVGILSLLKVRTVGSDVYYNNVVVGSIAGSTDTTLKITFNNKATSQVVEDVAQQVVYINRSNDDPSLGLRQGSRDIQYQITDGDGGTSQIAHKNLQIWGVNDAPQIAINDADKLVSIARNQILNLGAMNLFTVTDPDEADGGGLYQVTLSVKLGLLDIDTTGLNVVFKQDPGTGRSTLVFTGSLTDINIALDRLIYKSATKGTDTLSISVLDLNSNNFLGGITCDSDALKIKVS